MLTQCPHCLTLFRIGPEQLKAATGKVRCSRCNQVFNAIQHLEDIPSSFIQTEHDDTEDFLLEKDDFQTETDTDDLRWDEQPPEVVAWPSKQPVTASTSEETDTDDADARVKQAEDTEGANTVSGLDVGDESIFVLEKDDGLDTEPDYFDIGTESQMSDLLDQDTTSILTHDEERENEAAEIINFMGEEDEMEEDEIPPGHDFGDNIQKDEAPDLEEGKPNYESVPAFRTSVDAPTLPQPPAADESIFAFEPTSEPEIKRSPANPVWIVGSIVLLLMLGSQIIWQFRDQFIQYDVGRRVVTAFCGITGCTVPIRRNTDKIIIQSRNLSTHPDVPGVLFMQLVMLNTATFEQPFPKVQLSLFNDKGKLIARRIFTPDEYLPADERGRQMMPKAQQIHVEMQLIDPGKEVTGFTFEFL
jgi:predicted Zn finger-like uncharacterized protein